jgi:chromosome segregation ATPase
MKNGKEDELKALDSRVLDLSKEKKSMANKHVKLKAEQDTLQKDANHLAGELERNKELRRREVESLRKELDNQQRKAKQSTIEYTEARNELLELLQASVKAQKDFEELTREKEERSTLLTKLKDKLQNEHDNLTKEINALKESIFQSEE